MQPRTTSGDAVARRPHSLLERDAALAVLARLLDAARDGAGAVCLVTGEAGIGKTALLRHAAALHTGDARWVWGSCDPLSTPRALGPLHDAARALGGTLAERLFVGAPREAVFAGVLDALDEERAPTVLVIEDLHWADQATLDFVVFLARRIAGRRALLLVTTRDEEAATDPLFLATIGTLSGDVVHRLSLEPLSADGVAALAARAGRASEGLHETTGGNPFFVTEMLTAAAETIPRTVRDAVLARARVLSPAAQAALDLVATIPGGAELDLLERGLGVDVGGLREAMRAGLLVASERAVAFRHELARLAVESALDALARRELNARVLHALADRRETIGDVPLARLVHHARAAGDVEAICRWAPPAAAEAAAASAHREALHHFELALAHGTRFTPLERATLLEGLSVEAYLLGRTTDAIAARADALAIWRDAGAVERAGAAQRWLSRLYWWAGDPENAARAGDDAVRTLETLPPGRELAMAWSNVAQLRMLAQDDAAAIEWGERAVDLARTLGDDEVLAHALVNLGTARLRRDGAPGAARLEEAFAMASAGRMDDHAQRALVNLATTRLERREYAEAERAFSRALAHAEAHDLAAYAHYLMGQRARLRLECGDWDLAEADARSTLVQRTYPGVTTIPALVVLGTIQARRGDAEAAATLARAREYAYPTREVQRIGPTAAALAEDAWLAGDVAATVAEADHGLAAARAAGASWAIGELAWRLSLAGRDVDAAGAAPPWRMMLDGRWRDAAAAWAELGCPWERAEALALGDEAAMREALTVFDRLGAPRRARILRDAMRARGLRVPAGPRSATRANPAGLTARQVDVLRLVAERYTNEEIAERLHLAPKTVDHHVSAILGKLGVATRHAAARAARERGLVGEG